MYAACFGPFSGHHQAHQNKKLIKKHITSYLFSAPSKSTACPTTYQTRHFFNNSKNHILQRDLNMSTFLVWEMKRNVSVVRLVVVTRSSGPPASQPACILPDAPFCLFLCHLAEGDYSIWLLFVSAVYSVSPHSWKIYRYNLEERVFIVRTYWKTESIKLRQQQFL
jgi:hypothetical protein